MVKSITKRWLVNIFGVVFILLFAIAIGLSLVMVNYYYSSIKSTIESRIEITSGYFENYVLSQNEVYNTSAKKLVDSFAEGDKIELQMLDLQGNILYSSTAYNSGGRLDENQYNEIMTKKSLLVTEKIEDEKVMNAVRVLYDQRGAQVGIMCMRVSMTAIDSALASIIAMIFIVVVLILTLVFISSTFFTRSIVYPMREINKIAKIMSSGDLSARIEKKYDDEIGQLAQSINDMAKGLSETEKLKSDFLSSVSHELRTPLTSIKGWSETMMMSDPKTESDIFDRGIHVISTESDRLSQMVEELLDFSRIQEGKFKMSFSLGNLIVVIRETEIMFKERIEHEMLRLSVDVGGKDNVPVYMDKNRIKQVLINIIDNSVKHSKQGGEIIVALKTENNKAVITVTDFGHGISKEHLPQIKQRFYKADTAVRGAGLGLAISDSIVKAHMGSLDIDSEENVSTVVTITLPLYDDNKEQ